MEMNNDIFTPDLPIPEPVSFEDAPIPTPVEEETPAAAPPPRRRRKADAPVLTIESGDEIETEDAREAAAWHEIHNAYRTRRILSAPLGGIEQTDSGKTIAVVDYNGFRIVIPLKEMMVMPNAANSTESMVVRQMKLLGNIDTRKFFSICPPVWSIYRQDSHMAAVILFRFSRGIARVIHSTNS